VLFLVDKCSVACYLRLAMCTCFRCWYSVLTLWEKNKHSPLWWKVKSNLGCSGLFCCCDDVRHLVLFWVAILPEHVLFHELIYESYFTSCKVLAAQKIVQLSRWYKGWMVALNDPGSIAQIHSQLPSF
jgi:hypothetical protein